MQYTRLATSGIFTGEVGGGGDIPLMQHTRLATSGDFNGRVSVPLMLHKRLTTNGAFILFKYVNELC